MGEGSSGKKISLVLNPIFSSGPSSRQTQQEFFRLPIMPAQVSGSTGFPTVALQAP